MIRRGRVYLEPRSEPAPEEAVSTAATSEASLIHSRLVYLAN
jgi:hypothetical protein